MIIQQETIRTPDGQEVTYFDINDVVMVEGHRMLRKRYDVGFQTREEAETFVARHG